jgi:hypothetical protein
MIEHSESVVDLFKALHAAQKQLTGVRRDSTNPHFKNRYASLEAVIDAAKAPLSDNGLAFTQAPGAIISGAVEVTTMLMHTSGQWLRSTLHVPLSKTDPQGCGSAITYGCRYALMATLGLPPVDDDAEAATGRVSQDSVPARPVAAPTVSAEQARHAKAYVQAAKNAILTAKNESDLKSWWSAEKPNRDRFKLSASEGLGLELVEAYGDRKAHLQSELAMAG